MTDRISKHELESYLWDAADLLRGLIDASDFKQYIFPLLFFKRLSDVWDDDYKEAYLETKDKSYSIATANDRFTIPKGAHWEDIRSSSRDLGRALVNAYQKIESANPERLKGIFGNASWTDKEQMPDATLKDLIEHFSKYTLSLSKIPEDELGNGYEYLIKQFADDSGHTAQEFYTNRTVVHLMTKMLDPRSGERIYDPTCGTGGMLISCIAEVKRKKEDTRTMKLYGQELINITAAIARMNLVLHGVSDFEIRSGNTLVNPALHEGDQLKTFDIVLANPPYSIKKWNREAWLNDEWGRNFLGIPPQGRADYAFLQHIIKSMDTKTGRCAILFPHGVLFRKEERDMRIELIKKDLIECVLGLGANLFYNSPMEACIIICRSNKSKEHKNKILFINALKEVVREFGQSFLSLVQQRKILHTYREFNNQPGFSYVATTEEVIRKDGDLSIPKYVEKIRSNNNSESHNFSYTWKNIESDSQRFWNDMESLIEILNKA